MQKTRYVQREMRHHTHTTNTWDCFKTFIFWKKKKKCLNIIPIIAKQKQKNKKKTSKNFAIESICRRSSRKEKRNGKHRMNKSADPALT